MAQDIKFPRINSVMISGHLTRDIELRYTPKGIPIAKIGIAVNRNFKNAEGGWSEETSFIDVVALGKWAESSAERLHKGSPIIVEGSLRSYTYTTKDNQQRKITEITANKIHYLEKQDAFYGDSGTNNQPEEDLDTVDSGSITDDDVPF